MSQEWERPTWWPEKTDGLPTSDLVDSVYAQVFALMQELVTTDLPLSEYQRSLDGLYSQISHGYIRLTWDEFKKCYYHSTVIGWHMTGVHEGEHALITANLMQEMKISIHNVNFGFGLRLQTRNGEVMETPVFDYGDLYSLIKTDKGKYIQILQMMLLGSIHPSIGDMNMMQNFGVLENKQWNHPGYETAKKSLSGELLLPTGGENVLTDLREVPLDGIQTDVFGGFSGLNEYIGISLPEKIARFEAPYITCRIIFTRLKEIGLDVTSESIKKFIRTLINDSYWGITSVAELCTNFTTVTGIEWDEKVQKAIFLLYAAFLIPYPKQDPSALPYMR